MGAASGYCHSLVVLHYMTVIFPRTAVIIFCITLLIDWIIILVSLEITGIVTSGYPVNFLLWSLLLLMVALSPAIAMISSSHSTEITNKTNAPLCLKFFF